MVFKQGFGGMNAKYQDIINKGDE